MNKFGQSTLIGAVVGLLVIVGLGFNACQTVPAGHVAVATLFGDVKDDTFEEGLHFPVNPLYGWHFYDARQKTHTETANVPTQDQMQTKVDVSVQYRLNREMAATILSETGTAEDVVQVHLVPTLRSVLREQGKTVVRAEDLFGEGVQNTLQENILSELQDALAPQGLIISEVRLRDMELPLFIREAIEQKKEREQAAERQVAELERQRTEAQLEVVTAEARKQAAAMEAQTIQILADARAGEIEAINNAIANNPAYIQLEALKTLQAMSENPAAQLYFLNSDSPMPLPLMNVGAAAAQATRP